MKDKVNILGTEYAIMYDVAPEDMPENCDGAMDHSTKTIVVAKMEPNRNSVKDLEDYKKKVIRHEITHAFLYESGCWGCSGATDAWGMDETVTDWIAIQSPKLFKAFQDVGCL